MVGFEGAEGVDRAGGTGKMTNRWKGTGTVWAAGVRRPLDGLRATQESAVMPTRIRTYTQRSWCIVHESQWPVIRTEIGRSSSYADWPKHSWVAS